MKEEAIIECVPNFSEGRNLEIIRQITNAIETTEGVKLLNVDPGKATNRTVVTFVGSPQAIVDAAFSAIQKAASLIDMRQHKGEHPRMGATDVCPLIPVSGITMEETIRYAVQLARRVGEELQIPVYLYEHAQPDPNRKNLSVIRAGEYEGFSEKIKKKEWKPDFGPSEFPARQGATVIGARDFLVAYNVNLNTTSTRRANAVAFDVREAGRKIKNEKNEEVSVPGKLKAVKAIGWYIEEYNLAQVSMNLTNINITPIHLAFEACRESAASRGMRVTGSELVGLIPLKSLLDAGKYFLEKQKRSAGVSEHELIRTAIQSMGLNELGNFDPQSRIIEYCMSDKNKKNLADLTLRQFADEMASESPAPGGGSASAYVGALGAALATMVANLSSHKKGWDEQWKFFSDQAESGQAIKDKLLKLVEDDTNAFKQIMESFSLPRSTDQEKKIRLEKIEAATLHAMEVPLQVMRLAWQAMPLAEAMIEKGNPNSLSDAGVALLCLRTAALGAGLNVRINASGLKDETIKSKMLSEAHSIREKIQAEEARLLSRIDTRI